MGARLATSCLSGPSKHPSSDRKYGAIRCLSFLFSPLFYSNRLAGIRFLGAIKKRAGVCIS